MPRLFVLHTIYMEPTGDIALIGLAVMGQNLILNMNDHGYTVVAYNRTVAKVDEFLAREAKGTKVIGAHSIQDMVSKLKRPRRVMMLVKAGAAVDEFIEQLIPHLEPGDIIIDGGNSLFDDTNRRVKYVESKGLLYIGTGVSGGEEGARRGPSIMPGGSPAAWPHVKGVFKAVSAKVEGGAPCCDWVGEEGAGRRDVLGVVLLEPGQRAQRPARHRGVGAERVGQVGGGLVEGDGHVGHAGVGGQDRPAEAVLEGEPADGGEVLLDGRCGPLPVGGSLVAVVVGVDQQLAAVDAAGGVHVGGIGLGADERPDRKSTRLNSSHVSESRMPSSA